MVDAWSDRLADRARRPTVFKFLIWAAAAGLTALTGPFDTYDTMELWERLVYWAAVIGVGMIMAEGLQILVRRVTGETETSMSAEVLTSIALAFTFGPLLWWVNLLLIGEVEAPVALLLQHILVVLLVSKIGIAVRLYVRGRPEAIEPPAHPTLEPSQLFLRRLDPELGECLLRVSADDHYLLVITAEGEGRVLMRFRDALEELAHLPGYQIHRSHWVAREALVRVRQDGRRYLADLSDGKVLPVSSAYVERLREDGFMD